MSPLDYKLFYQRHLPHYQPPGATLFITFRLAGSLPQDILQRLETETRLKTSEIEIIQDPSVRKQAAYTAQKQLFAKWDAESDSIQPGPDWLANPVVAKMLCEALHFRDGRVYSLEAYSIMPNHVHLVIEPLPAETGVHPISKIMQSLKGYTARQANRILGRQGDFWQHESYDHVVRDNAEFTRIVNYVLENPLRNGLPARWVYCRDTL